MARRSSIHASIILAVFVGILAAGSAASGDILYQITGLQYPAGALGNQDTQAIAINNAGDVAGGYFTGQILDPTDWQVHVYHAATWHNGVAADLHNGASPISMAVGINDQGQVLIYKSSIQWTPAQPMAQILTNGVYQTIDTWSVTGMNNLGQAIGEEGTGKFFMWSGDEKTYITGISGTAINDAGQIAGTASGEDLACVYTPGPGVQLLTTPDGRSSFAYAINNLGDAVGESYLTNDPTDPGHAAVWVHDSGQMLDLGTLSGESVATGINEAGLVVGWSGNLASGNTRAFLYQNGALRDLNDLISADSGWVLEEATDINDLGQIVGNGTYYGENRGFVLTLAPEPATVSLLALGGLAMLRRRSRQA